LIHLYKIQKHSFLKLPSTFGLQPQRVSWSDNRYNEELHHEEHVGIEGEVNDENSFSALGFPIGDLPRRVASMKNIPLSTLPNFHGLYSKDPE
jgi:hypothetical protein